MQKLIRQFQKQLTPQLFAGIAVGGILTLLAKYLMEKPNSKNNRYDGKRFVGIQLGGTNYNVAIGQAVVNQDGDIIDFRITIKKDGVTYENPDQSLAEIIDFLMSNRIKKVSQNGQPQYEQYSFIGIASFGPLSLHKNSPTYGYITSTPKQLWRNKPLLPKFMQQFKYDNKRFEIDTDVNAAAYAEFRLGKHEVKQSLVYITVGTGVGVGVIVGGKSVHGLTHPEGGHITVSRSEHQFQHFEGTCPFHRNCLQGMVNNRSIAKRLNIDFTLLSDIQDSNKIWKIVSHYLGQLCLSLTLTLSPELIIIGGGIMNRKILYTEIRQKFVSLLNNYVSHPKLHKQKISQYIVAPKLGNNVGVKGGMCLSMRNQQ